MTQRAVTISWWRGLPWLGAAAMTPGVLLLHHLDPCDSTLAIASGNSLLHIGLNLTVGLLTALGFALQPVATTGESFSHGHKNCHLPWKTLLVIACGVAIVWLVLATMSVSGRGNLRFAVNGFWQWTSMLIWSASIGALATRPGFTRLAITAALALGVGVLVYGYWEYGVIQPELRRQLERDPIGLFRRQGVSPESASALLLADRIRSTEMKGFYALANSLGGFLACYWILAIGVWTSRRSRVVWLFHTALVILVAVGLLLTKSRTAWLAAGGGTAFLLLLSAVFNDRTRSRTLATGLCIASAIVGGGLMIIYLFDPLILKEAGKSLAYRFDYWRGATTLIFREPWFGYGVGGFQSTYLQVKLPTAAESPADPHNFLLETAHAGGIPCLLSSLAAIGLALWLACTRANSGPIPEEGSFAGEAPILEGKVSATRSMTICFWSGTAFGAICLVTWSIFTDSDERLYGILSSLAAFAGAAVLWTRWPAAATSAHLLVKNSLAVGMAFAVVLVHCLASGGWLLPGTMSLGMYAIGLGLAKPRETTPAVPLRTTVYEVPSHGARWGIVGAASLLLGTWYGTMAVPMLRATEVLDKAVGSPLSNPSMDQLRSLLIADRWDPELARVGMEWTVDHLSQPMGRGIRKDWEELLREFQTALQQRDPRNALAWEASGQASFRVAAVTPDTDARSQWLDWADQAFQEASDLSPASAQGHIQAALAAHWVGDFSRCEHHCRESEKIDTATRHRDRKIAAAQVVWPAPLVPPEADLGGDARRGMSRDCVKAEPVLRYLRSHVRP